MTRRHSPFLRATGVVARSLVALLSLAVVAASGWAWVAFGDVDANTVTTDVIDDRTSDGGSAGANGPTLDGALNILLVGLDSRTDSHGNPLPKEVLAMLNAGKSDGERNTDTMILVHIPAGGRRAVAFSFPRDSWVDVGEGFGKHKLNSAFIYAYTDARRTLSAQGVTDPKVLEEKATVIGRKNLISTIERLAGGGLHIDRYAEVNLASFYEVTNAVGGVEVCLKNPVDEWRSGARFPAGRQVISGAAALSFVRQRYELPNSDFDRIVRQQVFLGALADKVLSADMLTNPSRAKALVNAVQNSVVLSSNWNLTLFAAQMQSLSSGNIEFRTIPTLGEAKIGGADVVKVDPEAISAAITQTIAEADGTAGKPTGTNAPDGGVRSPTATAKPGGGVTVEVRNGSNTRGLATTVLDRLAGAGFTRGPVGDASVQQSSVIRYPAGELTTAKAVAESLVKDVFTFAEDRTLDAKHVRVVLGTSFAKAANQLDAKPLVGVSSPSTTTTAAPPSSSGSSTPAPPTASIEAGKLNCVN
ncbi:LCP family protein [Actinokineospora auranticolor]|uniref:LCP family protein n=1 Tax=Actinokineospora auranticolor TaxID=155976 RepID=UPI000CEC77A3|nr:LCP family protein [Actinokineospora auranticolor]